MGYTGKKPTNVVDVSETQSLTVDGDLTIADKIVHSGDTNTAIRFAAADTVTIETAGSERVRVDSNGQLGIGVTSVDTALHVKSANDTVAIIESSDATSKLQIKDSDSTNGASLAVTNETFNIQVNGGTRATINSSGNVGIGTTTPEATLDVMGNSDSVAALKLNGGNDTHGFHFYTTASEGDLAIKREVSGTQTEVMRLQRSSGNVQIGSTNSGVAGTLDVSVGSTSSSGGITLFSPTNGTHSLGFADGTSGTDRYRGYLEYQHASDAMTFGVQASEAMRIDSSPQVLMGKTVANLTTAGSLQAANATSDGSPAYFYMIKTFSGTRNAWLNYHSGTYVGGINMTNTSTSFPTSSDERLKKNIVDAPSAGDKIDAMQVRSFNWKADDSFQEYGLIAQELEPVYDLPVEQHDTEDTYTVDYSKLVPILLKEIQDLRKRVATLENN
jgi:hypothetical protein